MIEQFLKKIPFKNGAFDTGNGSSSSSSKIVFLKEQDINLQFLNIHPESLHSLKIIL